ncbi:MAG: monovalent cation/H(+) antiporter subunit G [Planctomycetota bacterium]
MIVLELIACLFVLTGSFFSIVGGIGIVRLPEFYSRLHGGGITDTLGAGLIVIGLMMLGLARWELLTSAKLAIILFFLSVTSPASCHALAKSALVQGLKPELEINTLDSNRKSKV